ncbi:MAG: DUF4282 domain-containing protein [Alphaproteobacteria bacterium]
METQDFLNFDKMIAPTLIKFVYWVGLVLILLWTVWSMFMGLGFGSGIVHFFVAALTGVVGLLAWRIVCELWMVIFSINERLGALASQRGA